MTAGRDSVTTHRLRWPYFGAPQRRLLFAGLGAWLGTAMPWFFFRPLGLTRYASPLAASWMLWAGLMLLAAAVSRWRLLALLSALGGGGTALILGSWQMLVILRNCGIDVHLQCIPGPGVIVVETAAAVALVQSYHLFRMKRPG